ncbi:succinate dehydrogenase, cytochrome b556 subunit [Rhizobium glycinendophyticum]|uniref:Succinate dehydrogenase cytochrome b556 subunit n=1 Tax=Rhizobium glycinendophyticum TaxID=2589807 RepID=A0A504TTX5_9HYPH|nr:succinate dehydrogenase, cytochrome b556 subunit [Rhizobium glycinendophyticum]TPP04947.1 succinate dehydrogenase, cytochrome b556 subunit [Rhizobium glycinendophyticum]
MSARRPRPVSPHLTVWRWQIWAIASITHRITGVGLYFAGTVMLTWYLTSLATGPEAYETFCGFAGSWVGQFILIGLTWTLFQHMASGMRHLFMDTAKGFERSASRRSASLTFLVSASFTVALWLYIWLT